MEDTTLSFNPPRGMRDFYPEDMARRDVIFAAWREAATLFGFQPYDACVVESLDLLRRKSGEEIVEQIYTFTDKSGRALALRPEMTPSLARMVLARQGSLTFPIKWYAIAQCFRYERMSKGRKREHFQWNLDILGEESVSAEAEVIATAVTALSRLGLSADHVQVHYSSRALMSELFVHFGIPVEHHAATFLAVDKLGKIGRPEIEKLLRDAGLADTAVQQVFSLFDLRTLDDVHRILGPTSPAIASMRTLESCMTLYGMRDILHFDITVVRGLSYYTGIVFECFDRAREFRAIFGGGRYDNLLADMGGKPLSGVGLGFGDVVVGEVLAATQPSGPIATRALYAVGYMTDAQREVVVRVAASCRADGVAVDLALHPEKARHFFSRVGNGRFSHAIYVGPDDVQAGTIRIKDLLNRTEQIRPVLHPLG